MAFRQLPSCAALRCNGDELFRLRCNASLRTGVKLRVRDITCSRDRQAGATFPRSVRLQLLARAVLRYIHGSTIIKNTLDLSNITSLLRPCENPFSICLAAFTTTNSATHHWRL